MPVLPIVDATGVKALTTAEIRQNIVDALAAASEWGPGAQTDSDKALGQILDIYADQLGLVYEAAQELYDQWDKDAAEGVFLDNLMALLGLTRDSARRTRVRLDLTGTPLATLAAGRQARIPNGPTFEIPDAVTFDAGGAAGGVEAESVDVGAIEAPANSVTAIVTADADWLTVNNPDQGDTGRPIEEDTDYSDRSAFGASRQGRSTDFALQAALDDDSQIDAATVISNRELEPVDGIPGKAFEAVVWPDYTGSGFEAQIAETVWQHTPDGIKSHGDRSAIVTDSQGEDQLVKWSYATVIEIYWAIVVETDPESPIAYPPNGNDLVTDAVVTYGASLSVGGDVLPDFAIKQVLKDVPGIRNLTVTLKAGSAPGPTDVAPISVSLRELGETDPSRIVVTP